MLAPCAATLGLLLDVLNHLLEVIGTNTPQCGQGPIRLCLDTVSFLVEKTWLTSGWDLSFYVNIDVFIFFWKALGWLIGGRLGDTH